jgi:hypothetical protein
LKDPIEKLFEEIYASQQNETLEAIRQLVGVATTIYKESVANGLPEELAAKIVVELITAPFKGASQ